jgi:subtilisin family serine protease
MKIEVPSPVRRATRLLPVVACSVLTLGASAAAADAKPIAGHYIVTVKPGEDAKGIARAVAANPRFVYSSALNGFAAQLNAGQLNALRHNPDVELVEQDEETAAATTQYMDSVGEPWGLDRIDQTDIPLSRSYTYNATGTGVRAYVIDSGLQANHPEFGARAANMYDATATNAADCNGHGTHVAGTVGGKTYGVAKNVLMRGVKVIGCAGTGSASALIAGIDWVKANAIKPAVANISIKNPANVSVDTAVTNLVASGVFVAVSAGNDNVDACTQSPARAAKVWTTAASTKWDAKWSSSNWGACVDGYAPGASVKSAYLNSGTATMSGTSMASPHVAGVAALMCSADSFYCSPSTMTDVLTYWSTTNQIAGNPAGTPNRLLHTLGA